MAIDFSTEIPVAFFPVGRMFAPRSYLLDCHTPLYEEIIIPSSRRHGNGTILSVKSDLTISKYEKNSSIRRKIYDYFINKDATNNPLSVDTGYFIDFRKNSPGNWSHMLNDYLPMLFYILDKSNILLDEITVILPKKIPIYILNLFEFIGIRFINTDRCVYGTSIDFSIDPWWAVRNLQHEWVQTISCKKNLTNKINLKSGFPSKIFVTRKGSRCLINQQEVEDFLRQRGYTAIYIEDYSVQDQLSIFSVATNVVAIHGAGLAPLLYRCPSLPPIEVVELFPCGLVNRSFQVITQKIGGRWAGVRGRMRPEYIDSIYKITTKFHKTPEDDFFIDIASLEAALNYASAK